MCSLLPPHPHPVPLCCLPTLSSLLPSASILFLHFIYSLLCPSHPFFLSLPSPLLFSLLLCQMCFSLVLDETESVGLIIPDQSFELCTDSPSFKFSAGGDVPHLFLVWKFTFGNSTRGVCVFDMAIGENLNSWSICLLWLGSMTCMDIVGYSMALFMPSLMFFPHIFHF